MITAKELVDFVGASGGEATKRADAALRVADGLVNAYCRGRHKRAGAYRPGVDAVVLTVAARVLANPEQIQVREQIGPFTMLRGEGFKGFTLTELAVLNRYRKMGV